MDPNETLKSIRDLAAEILRNDGYDRVAGDRLAEEVTALDKWLSTGGFLPDAWLDAADRAR
jgi:hypothetical protein